MRILIVDDETDVQLLFQQKFRKELKEGVLAFDFAFSAEEALDYLREQGTTHLVLILSDINMPGMNGLELLRIIKAEYDGRLKVFIITAFNDEHNYQTAIRYGADDYIVKPIEFEQLKQKILPHT